MKKYIYKHREGYSDNLGGNYFQDGQVTDYEPVIKRFPEWFVPLDEDIKLITEDQDPIKLRIEIETSPELDENDSIDFKSNPDTDIQDIKSQNTDSDETNSDEEDELVKNPEDEKNEVTDAIGESDEEVESEIKTLDDIKKIEEPKSTTSKKKDKPASKKPEKKSSSK